VGQLLGIEFYLPLLRDFSIPQYYRLDIQGETICSAGFTKLDAFLNHIYGIFRIVIINFFMMLFLYRLVLSIAQFDSPAADELFEF
jgi:hypothetical protein